MVVLSLPHDKMKNKGNQLLTTFLFLHFLKEMPLKNLQYRNNSVYLYGKMIIYGFDT